MTREERAEKWFRGIPNAELISMEEKMNICDKAAREMMTDIFLMSAGVFIALLVFCGKMIFDLIVKLINYISVEDADKIYYIYSAVCIGVAIVFFVIINPLIFATLNKNKYIKSEAEKIIRTIEKKQGEV